MIVIFGREVKAALAYRRAKAGSEELRETVFSRDSKRPTNWLAPEELVH